MSKKEVTQRKVDLVQPNSVTYAHYHYTAVQENTVTAIVEEIQQHMTQQKPIQTDLFGHPEITLKASEIAQGNSKHYVLEQLKQLRKKDIEFAYVNQEGQTEDVTTGIINTVRNIRDTDFIVVEISTWAIPYLLYWGKGVGGTIYQKAIAVKLTGRYAKRLYKICCRWQDQGGTSMSLYEFRKMFKIENKYKQPSDLRKRVLNPAQKELKEKADLYFEYEINKVQSRSYNHISFKIFSQKAPKPEENTSYWYQVVYNFITRTYPAYKDDKAMNITDQLAEDSVKLREAFKKFQKLNDQYRKEEKTEEDIIKLTKHILKNDFEIKVK
jgi:plasmid replication initiation protein